MKITMPRAIKVKEPKMKIQCTTFLLKNWIAAIRTIPNTILIQRDVQMES